MRHWILCLLAVLFISGCANIGTLQQGTGGTTIEVRGKSYDEIWKAVVKTANYRLIIVDDDKETGSLRAEKGVGRTKWGEVVTVFVRPTTPTAPVYTVEVHSLNRSSGVQLTGEDWTTTIVTGIKAELGL